MKILITGAAGGIGYLTALTLAQRDHFVYLTCHTEKQALYVKEKVEDYKNIKVLTVDILNEEDIKKVLNLNIDVLISNAGVGISGSIIEHDINDIKNTFEVNVFSNFLLIKEMLKQMVDKDKGRIIIMSSLASDITLPFLGVYSATKASIDKMVKSLKLELKILSSNVKIALVKPGLYHTGFNNYVIDSKYNESKYFDDIKDIIYNLEHSFLFLFEKRNLDSIVIQIVRAVEDNKLKRIYKSPFFQALFAKISSFLSK